jgi:tetratricopeptide (TPR) repeat protein
MFAPRTAVEHLSTALTTAARLLDSPVAALHRLRGHAYDLLGEFGAARVDFEAALAAARASEDLHLEWELLLQLALLWAGLDFDHTRAYAETALDRAQRIGDDALAHTLNRLGNWHLNAGHLEAALQHHERALAVFERGGNRLGVAQTLELLGMANNLAAP